MNLIIRGISKSYGNNKALSDFSATFEPGIYALLGPNGSGKSTLMNIITDNLKADSGEILYSGGGEPENILGMGVRFREKIGFMPQYPGMYPGFTIEQFMRYMAVLKDMGNGMQRRERREYINTKICQVLTAVELQDISNRKIGALSGGMKQRLALAQAVLSDPEILILDEPTAGLDPGSGRNLIENLIKLRDKNGTTIIIVSHSMENTAKISDKIMVMNVGKCEMFGTPKEIFSQEERLSELSLGIPQITRIMKSLKQRGCAVRDDILTVNEAFVELISLLSRRENL